MSGSISILGSGWLGYPLALRFVQKKYDVKTSCTSEAKLSQLQAIGTTPFVVNIDALNKDADAFLQSELLVINIPADSIKGHRALLQKILGSPVKNVILVSTTSVYPNENQIASEDDELPESTRLAIENVFTSNNRIQTTVLRFAGLIGYRRHPGLFFSGGKNLSNPDAPVNLIHRDDCIEIIGQIIKKNIWNQIFNCCADTHPSKKEFYTHAAAMLNLPPPSISEQPRGSSKTVSNQKLKSVLKYTFIHPDLMTIDF
ncbi:MAG: SDR family NAD(P)-dependent oxidoreductase [Deltaproteobacteria bacterium]|nr:SDR family NAD(P)-dependent oxidoreductase [Deltaproteobacteria bacterium]